MMNNSKDPDPCDIVFQKSLELDSIILERRNRIKVLKYELKVIDDETKSAEKELEWLESEKALKCKELELREARQKDQEQQVVLLEEVRAQLINEIKNTETRMLQKSKQYTDTLSKYDAIWESYLVKYKTFPLVRERDALQIQVYLKDIEVKKKVQELADKRKQAERLEEIRALQGKVLSREVKELYLKHQELKINLEKLKSENEEKKEQLREKLNKRKEEQQRLAAEEQRKQEEKLQAELIEAEKVRKSNEDLEDVTSKSSFTLHIPDLTIPDFDSMDDLMQTPVQFSTPFSSQIQPVSHFSSVSNVKALIHQDTYNVSQSFGAVPHFSACLEKAMDVSYKATISTSPSVSLEKVSIQEKPSSITTAAEKPAASNKEEQPLAQTSFLQSSEVEIISVEKGMAVSGAGTPSHKKEQMIKTDNIVAKLRDLVEQTNAEARAQELESPLFQSAPKQGIEQENSEKYILLPNASEAQCIQQEMESNESVQNKESHSWSSGKLDNLSALEKIRTSPIRSPTTASKESQNQDDSYAFNTDYGDLYDENSFEAPPNFGPPSTSDSDIGYTSPNLSPRSENLDSSAAVTNNDKQHQKFGGFSFFSSSTNIFGGPSTAENKEETGKSNLKTFFNF